MDPYSTAPEHEQALTLGLLRREPHLSRNRHYELFTSEMGRRALRRARWLRSLAGELERLRDARGVLTVQRDDERTVLRYQYRRATRETRLSALDLALLREAFPRLFALLELETQSAASAP